MLQTSLMGMLWLLLLLFLLWVSLLSLSFINTGNNRKAESRSIKISTEILVISTVPNFFCYISLVRCLCSAEQQFHSLTLFFASFRMELDLLLVVSHTTACNSSLAFPGSSLFLCASRTSTLSWHSL